MGIENLVNAMGANYKQARAQAKTFSGEKVPAGKYEATLSSIKIHEKKDSDKISLMRVFTILSGEAKGMAQTDFLQLTHPVGLSMAMQFIEIMGYDIPDSPSEWPDIIEAINEEQASVIVEVVHSGDFVNIKVLETFETEEAVCLECGKAVCICEDPDLEEEEGLDLEGLSRSELKQILKDSEIGFKVYKTTTDAEIIEAIEKANN